MGRKTGLPQKPPSPRTKFVGESRIQFSQSPCYSILGRLHVRNPCIWQLRKLILEDSVWSSSCCLAATYEQALVSQASVPTVTVQGQTRQEAGTGRLAALGKVGARTRPLPFASPILILKMKIYLLHCLGNLSVLLSQLLRSWDDQPASQVPPLPPPPPPHQ